MMNITIIKFKDILCSLLFACFTFGYISRRCSQICDGTFLMEHFRLQDEQENGRNQGTIYGTLFFNVCLFCEIKI